MSTGVGRVPVLTPRERDVLVSLCRPCVDSDGDTFTEPSSIRAIAEELGVTQAAVKQHHLKLYDKFRLPDDGERRRVRLANDAIALGVVSRSDGVELESKAAEGDAPVSIREARSLRASRSWAAAFRAFAAADAAGDLRDVADLEALGETAWWSGHAQESVSARLRAYAILVERGAQCEAAMVALYIATNYITRLSMSAAGGWLSKARRHLEEQPERREHGHLAMLESLATLAQGELDTARARARVAVDIGKRHRDRDLIALGHTFEACVLARRGALAEAKALFDEAMASASTGELGAFATGMVYCRTICSCLECFDYRRASEWTDVVRECGAPHGADGFPGDCRAHRAAVLVHRGQWDAADEAFRRAHELGADTEPGTSMLRLACGEAPVAAVGLRAALQQAAGTPLRRARLLPVQVDVAIAHGDLDEARAAAAELAGIAHDYQSAVLGAAAAFAAGRVALASSDLDTAAAKLRESHRLWLTVPAPYEAARARLELGRTLAAQKNDEAALLEIQAANVVFERLGAPKDFDAATAASKAMTG